MLIYAWMISSGVGHCPCLQTLKGVCARERHWRAKPTCGNERCVFGRRTLASWASWEKRANIANMYSGLCFLHAWCICPRRPKSCGRTFILGDIFRSCRCQQCGGWCGFWRFLTSMLHVVSVEPPFPAPATAQVLSVSRAMKSIQSHVKAPWQPVGISLWNHSGNYKGCGHSSNQGIWGTWLSSWQFFSWTQIEDQRCSQLLETYRCADCAPASNSITCFFLWWILFCEAAVT